MERYCEGKDKSIIINQLMYRNICVDNIIKFQLPQTWNGVKGQPNERVLSFLCSIVNTHISIFIMQVFRRRLRTYYREIVCHLSLIAGSSLELKSPNRVTVFEIG